MLRQTTKVTFVYIHANPPSELPAVIGPVEQGLPLTRAAEDVTGIAIGLYLRDVALHCFPTADLPPVFVRRAAAHVIAAIPLEPAAWVVIVNPALPAPFGEGLAGIDAEKI